MNFGDDTFITPPKAARGIIERATEAGIGLEVEAFDVGHVVTAVRWLERRRDPGRRCGSTSCSECRVASTPRPRR